MWALVALLGCDDRTPAELYRDALRAETWESARAACLRLDGREEADCLLAAMEAHGRLEEDDCAAIPKGVWRDECLFLYAERVAKAGDVEAGLATCEGIGFGRECSFHLIREGARTVLRASMVDAAQRSLDYSGLTHAPDAERLFWKTWHRERLEAKIPLDPTECPNETCSTGARQTLLLTLNGIARARGEGFCDGSMPENASSERVLWVKTAETDAWVAEYVDGECARRDGRRRGPAGPDATVSDGQPPEPGMGGMGVAPGRAPGPTRPPHVQPVIRGGP